MRSVAAKKRSARKLTSERQESKLTDPPRSLATIPSANAVRFTSNLISAPRKTDEIQKNFTERLLSLENSPHLSMPQGHEPVARAMRHLQQATEGQTHLTLGDLLEAVGKEGPALAASLLALPFLQPVPLPGLSTPLGAAISILGLSIVLQREIKLPKRLSNARLSVSVILKTIDYLAAFEAKLKRYLKSDATFDSPVHRRILGGAVAFHGILLALPLPIPFSNTFPAWLCFVAGFTILLSSRRLYALSAVLVLMNIAFWTVLGAGAVVGSSALVKWLGSNLHYEF